MLRGSIADRHEAALEICSTGGTASLFEARCEARPGFRMVAPWRPMLALMELLISLLKDGMRSQRETEKIVDRNDSKFAGLSGNRFWLVITSSCRPGSPQHGIVAADESSSSGLPRRKSPPSRGRSQRKCTLAAKLITVHKGLFLGRLQLRMPQSSEGICALLC